MTLSVIPCSKQKHCISGTESTPFLGSLELKLSSRSTKMKVTCFFETSVTIHPATQCHISWDRNPRKSISFDKVRLESSYQIFVAMGKFGNKTCGRTRHDLCCFTLPTHCHNHTHYFQFQGHNFHSKKCCSDPSETK
jgi:hypothetical protein